MNTKRILLLLASAAIFSCCTSCNIFSDDEKPKTELEKLPPPTQEGKNTFGYLLNGKAVVVKNTLNITAIFQQGQIQMGGGIQNQKENKDVRFILVDPILTHIKYDLTNSSMYIAKYVNLETIDICPYNYEDTYSGWISFSKIDKVNFIISGIFEFSTAKPSCDTVHITNGRFDMQYIP